MKISEIPNVIRRYVNIRILKKYVLFIVFVPFQLCSLDWMHFYYNGGLDDWFSKGLIINSGYVLACGYSGYTYISPENVANCYTKTEIIREENSRAMLYHKVNNEIWLFGWDTLFIYDGNNPRELISKHIFDTRPNISRVIEGGDGSVYANYNRNGLLIFDPETKEMSPFQSPYNGELYPEYVDSEGNMWFLGNGICKYDGTTWTHFSKENSGFLGETFHPEGNKIIEDENGHLIVSTNEEGLFQYDGQSWSRYASPLLNEDLKEAVSIVIDHNNVLWMSYGINCGYLAKYKNGHWEVVGEVDSTRWHNHLCNPIGRMVVDEHNRLWLATRHFGVFMINQDSSLSCKPHKRINITTPPPRSIIENETNCKIEWETYGYVPVVNIEARRENGEWRLITNRGEEIENESMGNWYIRDSIAGRYQIRVFSTRDSSIADTTDFFTITSDGQNLPPTLQNIPDSLEAKSEETTSWTAQATDPEGDPITYTFTDLPSWALVSQSTLTLEPTRNDSSTTLQVIAADTNGGADTADIYIAVIHSTTTEPGVGAAGPSANMLHVEKIKINLPAGKIKRVTLFNVQGKMIATADTKNEYTNLFRIKRNITDSFVVAKIEYADKTSIQRTICLME